MSKEELIEFLKTNLKIRLTHGSETTYDHEHMVVTLMLGDEVISEHMETMF